MSTIAIILVTSRRKEISGAQKTWFISQIINGALLSLLFDDVNCIRHGSRYVNNELLA